MSASTVLVLGRRLPPAARIAEVGDALGLKRSTAYRIAEADSWPMIGPASSRFVIVPVLLDRLGVSYEIDGGIDDAIAQGVL